MSAKIYADNAERQRAYRARNLPRIKAKRAAVYARDRIKQRLEKAQRRRLLPDEARESVWRVTGRPMPTRPRPEVCECCGQPPSERKALCNDHDHGGGRFRGWLCHRCNVGIGMLDDGVDGVLRALDYLARV